MANLREIGEVNLAVNSTIGGAAFGGGGGGGWFSDGAGSFSTIGKGSPVPTADGDFCFASGSTSSAGSAGGSSSFAWGNNAVARGIGSLSIGDNVGHNSYSDEDAFYPGQTNVCIGRNLVVTSASERAQTLLGTDIVMDSVTNVYGVDYAYNNYTQSQFAWGQDIILNHASGGDSGSFYYAYGHLAIVMGDDNYIDTSDQGHYLGHVMCFGRNNHIQRFGGVCFGSNNDFGRQNAEFVLLVGDNNDFDSHIYGPTWCFLDGCTEIQRIGAHSLWWGEDHDATGVPISVTSIGGKGHHVAQASSRQGVFLWGEHGSNGHQNPNEHMFGWAARSGTTNQLRAGACQYSFILDELFTPDATANVDTLFWKTDFRRGYKVNVEVAAYDVDNNDQTAIFKLENVLVYRSSHTGVPIISAGSPVAIPSIVDTGGNSASWTAQLVVDGTVGCKVQVTGTAATNVGWSVKLSYLETGHDAA